VPLALGVDAANVLRDRRGIGRYVRSMLRTWDASFASRVEATLLMPGFFPGLAASRLSDAIGVDRVRVAQRSDAERRGLGVVWYPWNGMTWTTSVRSAVTIHDLWPFVSPSGDLPRRAREQQHYLTAAARADRFIAVSRNTAREAVSFLGIDPSRIDIVPHGVERLTASKPVPAKFADVDRYVLFVGEAEPRKDIATLIDAASRLPEALRRTTALVLAGRDGAANLERPSGLRIEATGEVSDERLASLYAGAAAFAFPSRYEGFGLPVLEAMQYGVPVIAADAAGIRDAGGDAAVYFPAGDAGALTAALTRVLDDQEFAQGLRTSGLARVAGMTLAKCAAETLEVLEHAAAI
jgi:alpha-1,3-rhamnosyl/mannosyltransferase